MPFEQLIAAFQGLYAFASSRQVDPLQKVNPIFFVID